MANTVQRFGIHLKVKDFNKSYKFYKSFDFQEEFAYGPKSFLETLPSNIPSAREKYRGVTFNLNNAMFEIAEDHIAIKPEVFKEEIKSSKISAMIDIESIGRIVEICKINNYSIVADPKDYYWGTREVVVKDPDGFILVFRQKI